MKETFNRPLKVGDLVLVGYGISRCDDITESSYGLVVAEDRVYISGFPYLCGISVYLIENPIELELQKKQELMVEYNKYQQAQLKAKAEASRVAAEKRKELKSSKIVKGDILKNNYNDYALYLGKGRFVNEITNTVTNGHMYISFTCRNDKIEEVMQKVKEVGGPMTFIEFRTILKKIVDKTAYQRMVEVLRRDNLYNTIKYYEPDISNIICVKSWSTKFMNKYSHIDLAENIGDKVTVYARKVEGRGWNTNDTYGLVHFEFME